MSNTSPDIFPDDPYIGDTSAPRSPHESLPQFGPAFVPFVDERFTRLEAQVERALKRWEFEPVTVVFHRGFNLSATGGGHSGFTEDTELYVPQPGFTLALHRLVISDAGHTFGNPYTAAGSWWELRVNDAMVFGNSMVSGQGQLPVIVEWGTRDAPRIRDGEVLSLFVSGGPNNAALTIVGQGTLDRTIEG